MWDGEHTLEGLCECFVDMSYIPISSIFNRDLFIKHSLESVPEFGTESVGSSAGQTAETPPMNLLEDW